MHGSMFFELVSILFAIVPDYGNEYTTKENKNCTSFKNFAPKLNLNHNTLSVDVLTFKRSKTGAIIRSEIIICLLHFLPLLLFTA